MPDYIANELKDKVMASIVAHLKTKYRLTQQECVYKNDNFNNMNAEPAGAPIQLYVVSHGDEDVCAMSAVHDKTLISPGAFAHSLINKGLPMNRPVRIKLAMCFGATPKPLQHREKTIIEFARQAALVLGSYGSGLNVESYTDVLIGGFNGEVRWAWDNEMPPQYRYMENGHPITNDKHSPVIKGSDKKRTNRQYFSVLPPGSPVIKPEAGFQRGKVFCYFPFDFPTK